MREIIGRYLEEHPSSMLEPRSGERGGLGTEIAAIFSKHGLDSPIPELRFTVQNPFEAEVEESGRHRADSRGGCPHMSLLRRRRPVSAARNCHDILEAPAAYRFGGNSPQFPIKLP